MHIKVLGCDGGIGDPLRTCALLVNDHVLLDAGTGVGELPLHELTEIDHIFLTHAHADHIASVPLLIDAVVARRSQPVTIHATEETLRVLKTHIFNWAVWPDFTRLPSPENPSMRLSPLKLGETIDVED